MAGSQLQLIPVKAITPAITCWAVKAQVNKLWRTVKNMDGWNIGGLQMILFDIEGDKIEATIREDIWDFLRLNLQEGKVYIFQNVSVKRNSGDFPLAKHDYKLELTRLSVVTSTISESLSQLTCLKPVPLEELPHCIESKTYCIDIAGWLSATSSVEKFVKDGSTIRRLFTQLTDGENAIECVFCDEYVEVIMDLLKEGDALPPCLAIQYGQLRAFGVLTHGLMYVETVNNVSNIIRIPNLTPTANSVMRVRPAKVTRIPLGPITKDIYDKFIRLYPHKKIADLHLIGWGGFCVVWAKIIAFIDNHPWWELQYGERLVEMNDTSHYSQEMRVPITPSYSLVAQLYDESGTAWCKLPKADVTKLVNVECHNLIMSTENPDSRVYPPEVMRLIGKDVLFLMEKGRAVGKRVRNVCNYHEGYVVHQICYDNQVLRMFHTKEFLTLADEVTAANVAQQSAVENGKMLMTLPAPETTIFEWMKKQREDHGSHSLGEIARHGNEDPVADSEEAAFH